MGRCLVRMARQISPKVVIGFHASSWSGSTASIVAYLNAVGASQADIVVVETLDRDAGCFEAAVDPNCQRGGGPFYWDESNATSPSFREHLTWARAIYDGIGRPLLWWQMPFGVPSSAPGGTAGHYRDNRVRYLFAHVDEFVAAGGFGAAFGVGAANQTYITTDGNQFRNAVAAYFASPTPLPPAGPPSGTGNFFTLAPCRVFDTRGSAGPYGGPALAAAERRVFALAGRCGIPASARAVTLNLTVTQPSAQGNIQLFPSDLQVPTTSTLNYVGGQTRANNAIVGLSASGALTVRSGQASGSAHVILDVTGYFE